MNNEQMFGGVVDDAPQGGNYKFGLNQKVRLTKFAYNPTIQLGSADKTAAGVELEFDINGQTYKSTIFPPSITAINGDPLSKEDINKNKDKVLQKLFHIAKCFATVEDITKAVAKPAPFPQYIENLKSVWENDWEEKELDLFFQYQWQLKEGADRKYLELPKDTKQGAFLVPHVEGNFVRADIPSGEGDVTVNEEVVAEIKGKNITIGDKTIKLNNKEMSLLFIDIEQGIVHPFQRTKWFMENGWGSADDSSNAISSWA